MSTQYDIVLLPEPALEAWAIDSSQALASYDPLFMLEASVCFPHVSLYMLQLDDDVLEQVAQTVQLLAKQSGPFTLSAKGYEQVVGYVVLHYQKTPELAQFQQLTLDTINPFRKNKLRPKDAGVLKTATGELKQNLTRYGFRGAGNLYRPHMTLSRLPGNGKVTGADLPVAESLTGNFTRLGFFRLGDHGTCREQIAVFPLA